MKKKYLALSSLIILLFAGHLSAQDHWKRAADFPGQKRWYGIAFTIGDKGYFGTGSYYDSTSNYAFNDIWEYDPAQDTWTQKSNAGGGKRTAAVAFTIGQKAYMGSGSASGNDFWEYEQATDAWKPIAAYPGASIGAGIAFSIGNKGYVGLGRDINKNNLTEFYEYDPAADKWTQKADFPGGGRFGAVAFSIGNKGYVGTGYSDNVYNDDLWEYNPATDKWTQKAEMGTNGRYKAIGFGIANKGYIGFGYVDRQGISNDLWAYDTTYNAWTEMSGCASSYSSFAPSVMIFGNRAFVTSGMDFNGVFHTDNWQYSNHTAGISTGNNTGDLLLYPNPNNGQFSIQGLKAGADIEILAADGRTVMSMKPDNIGTASFSAHLPPGIYILRVTDADGVCSRPFAVNP